EKGRPKLLTTARGRRTTRQTRSRPLATEVERNPNSPAGDQPRTCNDLPAATFAVLRALDNPWKIKNLDFRALILHHTRNRRQGGKLVRSNCQGKESAGKKKCGGKGQSPGQATPQKNLLAVKKPVGKAGAEKKSEEYGDEPSENVPVNFDMSVDLPTDGKPTNPTRATPVLATSKPTVHSGVLSKKIGLRVFALVRHASLPSSRASARNGPERNLRYCQVALGCRDNVFSLKFTFTAAPRLRRRQELSPKLCQLGLQRPQVVARVRRDADEVGQNPFGRNPAQGSFTRVSAWWREGPARRAR
ncbi:MAG: hypothetical protein BJ554DRAFT_160, partial [Olpidium bornovanus]